MDPVKADEATAKPVADANGNEENVTKAADGDGLLKAAQANDVVKAVAESEAVKALVDRYDEQGKTTVQNSDLAYEGSRWQ